MAEVFLKYGWRRCSIIWDETKSYWRTVLMPSLRIRFDEDEITYYEFDLDSFATPREAMEAANKKGRIILLVVNGPDVRQLMLEAFDMDLINGDYAFFSFYPFNNKLFFGDDNWRKVKDPDGRDEDAKFAYQALMNFKLYEPESEAFRDFQREYTLRQKRDYNFTRPPGDDFGYLSVAMHDAVILYSLAVNETLAENGDIRDGAAMTRKMWNRTFEGIYGTRKINENGDRDGDYSMWDMVDVDNGEFKVVANFYGATNEYEEIGDIFWPGGRTEAPADSPFCGYENENPACNQDNTSTLVIAGIAVACFLCILLIAIPLIYRKLRLDAEALNMSWKIRYGDLVFTDTFKSSASKRSSLSLSMSAGNEERMGQIFAKLANLEGRTVVVKNLSISKVDLTKNVLKELRNMRTLEHANITRFIGVCVDPPNVCVVVEYCPKGSLQDVLQNDSFKLDWSFKHSLMIDMAKGLHYIHGSVLGLHGRLSSSNCTIDSRFVLKLTDFGLHEFNRSAKQEEDKKTMNKDKLLWQAPEILRNAVVESSRESDVYSAGIVIYEIITRNEPFESERLDIGTEAIIEKLKSGGRNPIRPHIAEIDDENKELHALMCRCWAEKPDDRPSAKALLTNLRKLSKGSNSENILDNLLTRMEQYANNLESLVEERTAAFLEEKKRSETLLYEVLPKTVADQLKRGNAVDPETFEMVTIFFSDIVGFTSLSAASTPMQVVALLNDLYTCFDSIIGNFDVYKVETIGDAYMVVSGLPIPNGSIHAREIAGMSLELLKAVDRFTIRHVPDRKLQLRAGVHSGSCVAGVVGLKMPRYCLFGDTVNTASRMESNGEALKIHISSSTKGILDTFGTFEIKLRGQVAMKGKGQQTTYWLLSQINTTDESTA
ncbi:atrial natriuretic peptide receptor 1-like [Amphiura filiformis]|uniref:atrial natriuretic peptide receptor 1-like n=1 Tax=Amphiura filiformis TaxID=82378 RepID=UPI003B222C61